MAKVLPPPASPTSSRSFPNGAAPLPTSSVHTLADLPARDVLPLVLDFLGPRELGALASAGSHPLRGAVCTAWRSLLQRQWPGAEAKPGCAAMAVRAKLAERGCVADTPTFKCFPRYTLPQALLARPALRYDAVYGTKLPRLAS